MLSDGDATGACVAARSAWRCGASSMSFRSWVYISVLSAVEACTQVSSRLKDSYSHCVLSENNFRQCLRVFLWGLVADFLGFMVHRENVRLDMAGIRRGLSWGESVIERSLPSSEEGESTRLTDAS